MTRQDAPTSPPVVLTVAGSDSGGGAGIQADLKTVEACGGFGTSAVTSVTAQNTTGVESTHVLPIEEIDAQCEAVRSDFDVAAIKTGMLATTEVIDLVTDCVREAGVPAVVDPVMVAASGDRLLAREAEAAYEELIAEATLVTPNADEAAVLTDVDPDDEADARAAGERLVGMGADAALVKGGHLPGEDVIDVLVTADRVETFRHPRVDTEATHGSGCTLSSAVATHLAHGVDLVDAVGAGIDLLARAVRYNVDVGEGPGAVHHLVERRDAAARTGATEAVESILADFVRRDARPLIPEVGTNVAVATPYAERPDEVAAVDGRVRRTTDGVAAARGARMGASSNVARLLLAARERDPALRAAANLRYDRSTASALDALPGQTVAVDRPASPAGFDGGGATDLIERAFDAADGTPTAVVDEGGDGREALAYLLAEEDSALSDRLAAAVAALDE